MGEGRGNYHFVCNSQRYFALVITSRISPASPSLSVAPCTSALNHAESPVSLGGHLHSPYLAASRDLEFRNDLVAEYTIDCVVHIYTGANVIRYNSEAIADSKACPCVLQT